MSSDISGSGSSLKKDFSPLANALTHMFCEAMSILGSVNHIGNMTLEYQFHYLHQTWHVVPAHHPSSLTLGIFQVV